MRSRSTILAAVFAVLSTAGPIHAREAAADPSMPLPSLEEPGELDVDPSEIYEDDGRSLLMDFHFALGTTALSAFALSLGVGAASGNLGRLMDASACCDGSRLEPYRTIDRVLVITGISAYLGAGILALTNLLFVDPPSDRPRETHQAHRWLAIAHLTVFLVSAATGIVMFVSQDDDPALFADVAKAHVAANILLVPLLSTAMSDILFE